jgi:signal transduction histidine kinase
MEFFDLAAVTSQAMAGRQSEMHDRNLTPHAALGPAPAAGSPRLAERLAANLVDNAMRHNLPGGRVEVSTGTRNSRAVLSVLNTGPAVPAAAVERLFQPFQRLATGRASRGGGLGLGLSIVQAIAQAHSASITADPQPGGGLLVEVIFPDPGPHCHEIIIAPGIHGIGKVVVRVPVWPLGAGCPVDDDAAGLAGRRLRGA